ncbi:MAG: DUF975 family protein [Clostridia bacterium]|nr:DUF975 family protein [Clostridia bacterium]
MKTRSEIKKEAKAVLGANWGKCILPAFLYSVIVGAASSFLPGVATILLMPLAVGLYMTYALLMNGEVPELGTMFNCGFQENYGRKLAGMLLMNVYIFLWSLLFIIPGIVKAYSYCMTPYILAKYPNVPAQDAITLSRRIMNGNKGKMFVVGLSFIGWTLLGVITLGLTLILHTTPYMYLTEVGCYEEFLNDALANGRITEEDLRVNG